MDAHVHYDIPAFERDIRKNFEAARATIATEFERLQALGSEVVVQFAVFGAKMDNEGVEFSDQVQASAALIASLIENLAFELDAPREAAVAAVLDTVAAYAERGGEILAVTDAPIVEGGHA